MNRINKLFEIKKNNILSIFFTAGFPKKEDTIEILKALENANVDMVEIGIPFSDPVADGPIIQNSSYISLQNGMNLNLLFEQLSGIRDFVKIPIILMGYFNPILQYGVESFIKKCAEYGVDGLIIPDLPINIYQRDYKDIFEQFNLKIIFLIAPETSEEKILKIDKICNSFIYVVAYSGITGSNKSFNNEQINYFKRINKLKIKNPTLLGFGISKRDDFVEATKYFNGVIIGSKFVDHLSNNGVVENKIKEFVSLIINDEKNTH